MSPSDGTGDFYSIQRALDRGTNDNRSSRAGWRSGTYREVLTISKPHITLRSANPDASKTIVVNQSQRGNCGRHVALGHGERVSGDDFTAENVTFQNDFNATHPQLPKGSQALALLATGDRAVFNNVRLLGNQDTLFTGSKQCSGEGAERSCTPARQYFANCYIEGNVDFIFGDGKTAFENCEIRSNAHSEGFITAQGKSYPSEDSGYVFHRCRLTADPGVSNVFLGRPWRPYASVVYLDTEMGAHIEPAAWREWHPGETHSIETTFYAEQGSTGPGARLSQRDPDAHVLTPSEAEKYLPANFLRGSDGWNPAEHVN